MGGCWSRKPTKAIHDYFEDKVVWITGASGGLGEALSVELCRIVRPKGLVISARRKEELERVRKRCLELQPDLKIVVLPLDLAKLDTLPEKAKEAISAFGEIGVLVNNGGVGFRGIACETSLEQDMEVMNIDYFSGVALTKALLPSWLTAQCGHVVQISSVQAFFGLPGRTAYAAAKHAAVGFYDSLRAELADTGISVTVICPGYIKTGHSTNAVKGSGGGYPEGHTSKGVPAEQIAIETLAAAACKQPELVSAAFDARAGRVIRSLCPPLLFSIMQKRARKELKEREGLVETKEQQKPLLRKGDKDA
jgi:short-subunit dehydrogenase